MLQQLEDFNDGTVSVNDCFRPVSRYFDRITRPEQLIFALPRAFATMTDPAECGPVTLAICQDVQAEAYDWPVEFFARREWHRRRPRPGLREVKVAADAIRAAKRPLIIAGGGVHYAGACETLKAFVEKHRIPVGETQAGKSALPWDHPMNLGGIGVTGSGATNPLGRGSRCGDRGRHPLPGLHHRLLGAVPEPRHAHRLDQRDAFDTHKHNALPLVADAKLALEELSTLLGDYVATPPAPELKAGWIAALDGITAAPRETNALPTDAQVIGAVQRAPARRHRGDVRRRHHAGRAAEALEGRQARCPTTWNTATPAWATRSPAASGSRWPSPSATSS